MISVEEKRAAYEEARQLLLLGKKWQQLMPGERKPDFRRAAKAVIRRALGKSTVPREPDLDVHNGLMHEHAARGLTYRADAPQRHRAPRRAALV